MTTMQPPTGKPCRECPWRRVSAPEFLGPHSAEEWVSMAHGDGAIACHMTIPDGYEPGDDWEDDPEITHMAQCSGAAIFRSNICKSSRNRLVVNLPSDPVNIFRWNNEFIDHHRKWGVNS